jgi:hypothetical protein
MRGSIVSMERIAMIIKSCVVVTVIAAAISMPTAAQTQEMPAEYRQVLSTLGKQGDFKDNVLKVNIPRNDVKVTVAGYPDADAIRLRRLGGDDEGRR